MGTRFHLHSASPAARSMSRIFASSNHIVASFSRTPHAPLRAILAPAAPSNLATKYGPQKGIFLSGSLVATGQQSTVPLFLRSGMASLPFHSAAHAHESLLSGRPK